MQGFNAGTYIGTGVTVGHGAVIHAATLQDYCLIGKVGQVPYYALARFVGRPEEH